MENERKAYLQIINNKNDEKNNPSSSVQLSTELSDKISEKCEIITKEINLDINNETILDCNQETIFNLNRTNVSSDFKGLKSDDILLNDLFIANSYLTDTSKDLFPFIGDEAQFLLNPLNQTNFINKHNVDSGFRSNNDNSVFQCASNFEDNSNSLADIKNEDNKILSSFPIQKKETIPKKEIISEPSVSCITSFDLNAFGTSINLKSRNRPLFPNITRSEQTMENKKEIYASESSNLHAESDIFENNDSFNNNEINDKSTINDINLKNKFNLSHKMTKCNQIEFEKNNTSFSKNEFPTIKYNELQKSFSKKEEANVTEYMTNKPLTVFNTTISNVNNGKNIKILKHRLSTLIEALDIPISKQIPLKKHQNSLEPLDLHGHFQSINQNCLNEAIFSIKKKICNDNLILDKNNQILNASDDKQKLVCQKASSEKKYFLRSHRKNNNGNFCNVCGIFVQDSKIIHTCNSTRQYSKSLKKFDENKTIKISTLIDKKSATLNKTGPELCDSKRKVSRIPVSNISRSPLTPHYNQYVHNQNTPLRKTRRHQNVVSTIAKNLAEHPPPPLIQTVHPKRELRIKNPLTENNLINNEMKDDKMNKSEGLLNFSPLPTVQYTKNVFNMKQRELDRLTREHTIENSKKKIQYFPSVYRPTVIRHKGNKALHWAQHLTTDKSLNSSPSRISNPTTKSILVRHNTDDAADYVEFLANISNRIPLGELNENDTSTIAAVRTILDT